MTISNEINNAATAAAAALTKKLPGADSVPTKPFISRPEPFNIKTELQRANDKELLNQALIAINRDFNAMSPAEQTGNKGTTSIGVLGTLDDLLKKLDKNPTKTLDTLDLPEAAKNIADIANWPKEALDALIILNPGLRNAIDVADYSPPLARSRLSDTPYDPGRFELTRRTRRSSD